MPDKREGWSEYEKLVLSELERLDRGQENLNQKVDTIRATDLAAIQAEIKLLKLKSTLWGGVAGGIPAAILALLKIFGV